MQQSALRCENSFLHGILIEGIYVKKPACILVSKEMWKFWCLKKALHLF